MDISARNRLVAFLNDQRNDRIRFVETESSMNCHFKVDGNKVVGLHNYLKKTFYKEPSCPSGAEAGGGKGQLPKTKKLTSEEKKALEIKKGCKELKAVCHGKRVDQEFAVFCEHSMRGREGLRAYSALSSEKEPDPCTVDLIEFFRRKALWLPTACQVPVFSEELGMATAIDILARSLDDTKTVLVELKVSTSRTDARYKAFSDYIAFDRDYKVSYLDKNTPEEDKRRFVLCLENSQYIMDQMQLMLMKWIVEKEYGSRFDKYCVVRVHLNHVATYFLNRDLKNIFTIVLKALKLKKGT